MPESDLKPNERWSVHLEYLKVAIGLATATLAVAAAVYSDPTKMPNDNSRWALLACVFGVFVTLISSVLAVIYLANHVRAGKGQENKITWWAGASFFALMFSGLLLLVFFGWRTVIGGVASPQQAMDVSLLEVEKRYTKPGGAVAELSSFEVKNDRFTITYKVLPGRLATVVFDPKGNSITSMSIQP